MEVLKYANKCLSLHDLGVQVLNFSTFCNREKHFQETEQGGLT